MTRQDPLAAAVDRAWSLLADLVRAHPVHGEDGQQHAALALVEGALARLGMPHTRLVSPRADLRADPRHVDVSGFGGDFSGYWEKGPLHGVVGSETFGDGEGPFLVLNAHVDVEFVTSPDTWERAGSWRAPYEVDGRMVGRGTSDTLGGVVAVVAAVDAAGASLRRLGSGRLDLHFVLDEELGGNGTVAATARGGRVLDLAIVVEPTGGGVSAEAAGFSQLRVRLQGRPVHMVCAHRDDNAVAGLPAALACLDQLNNEVAVRVGRPGCYVLPGVVEAGTDAAVPADQANCLVTLALPAGLSDEGVRARLGELLQQRAAHWSPTVEPYGVLLRPAVPHDGAAGYVDLLCESARRAGVELEARPFPSACDARLYAGLGVPTLVYGPGELSRAHGSDEFVTRAEVAAAATALHALIQRLLIPAARR
jgi:acetylornithine deacetylase/succinyl-diaminopimelate desuccinylase-like protein